MSFKLFHYCCLVIYSSYVASNSCFQGGLTPTDVFAVEWVQSGRIHFGSTVTYFGFVSDGNLVYLFSVTVVNVYALQ